ncbi:hypothetical protein OF855_24650 [Mycolicibacterium fortuitum]|uniref:hypothetical protein n=1 Tax=Mycolicibacterium fortuitum TaxID=1766 RepID=UPI0022BA56E0|nr:hypothetical protein [Mycolicibacterium fortuitum]WAY18431.1 hypothetical protein OF855_24650 [Mycolicibacterium fortuitum]
MSATDLIAAWKYAADRAADAYTPFPSGWINQLPPDLADELKSIAAMCDESQKIMADASRLLGDILRDRLGVSS